MKKRLLSGLLALCMVVTLLPGTAWATDVIAHGICGDNLTWELDENGMLTISGTGEMTAYENGEDIPWYEHRTDIKKVIIENGVSTIGNHAFTNCSNLTSVIIPDSVTGVTSYHHENTWTYNGIFRGCELLTSAGPIGGNSSIQFGWKNTIPSHVFSSSYLTNVTVPDGVTNIGADAFSGCSRLTSVTIPDSVTNISSFAFSGCSSLTSVTIPNSVTSIGSFAFNHCIRLTNVTIPNSVTNILSGAFAFCSSLTNVTISNSVISIGNQAFMDCSSLTDVYFSGSEAQWNQITIGETENDPLFSAAIHYNSTGPDTADPYGTNTHILIYASKPLLANKVGDVIDFCCGIYTNDGQVVGWTNPSIVSSNPDLVYISGYFEEDSLAYFQVKGLAEGTCTLTITDSATGIYGKVDLTFESGVTSTKSYRIDQVPNFVVDESTWLFGEAKTQTNFYDVNGLYVNKFDSKYNDATGKYDVSFTVYNSRYYNGAVDVFDASGKWIETYEIGKVASARSIRDTFGDGWNLVTDLVVEKKGLSYTLSSSTQETPIKFSVPKGGYFTISNNYIESPGVFLFNVLEYIALSANTIFDLGLNLISGDSMDVSVLSSFKDSAKEAILDSEFLTSEFIDAMRSYAFSAAETSARFGIGEATGVMACSFEELLKSLDIDLETIAKTELGIAESAFRNLTGPISVGFSAMFSISKYGDLTTQTIEFLNSGNKPYIVIYATEDAYTNSTVNGVTVEDRAGSIDNEAVLQVFKLEYEECIPVVENKKIPTGQYVLYSICFLKNGEESPVNGTVTVMIPIPDSYKKDRCVILRQEEDGSWTELEYTIQDNLLVFETTHFSLYAIADVSDPASVVHFINDTLDLQISTSHKLEFNVEPMSASVASLVWESSNPIIANVDSNGTVSAFSLGTATISVTTVDGNTARVMVTVSPASTFEDNSEPSADKASFPVHKAVIASVFLVLAVFVSVFLLLRRLNNHNK